MAQLGWKIVHCFTNEHELATTVALKYFDVTSVIMKGTNKQLNHNKIEKYTQINISC